MRYGFATVLCLAAFAPSAVAQTVDKVKLRQAIELPPIATSLSVHFKSNERDGHGNKIDPVQKLADLQKKLNGTPDDALIYLEQSAIYLEVMNPSDEKKSKELALKAEAVLRPRMQTTDPKEGYLVAIYGTILETVADNPWGDCEKWARRAVSVAPQDWRTWAYLAHTRHQQIPAILLGGNDKELPKNRRTQEILGMLILKRLEAKNVDLAEKVLNEALQYHDKAKQLAPDDAKRQEQRYAFRLTEIVLRNSINVFRGEKPRFPLMQLERVLLDELQETARLQPEHMLWQSQLAHQLILLGWRAGKDKDGKPAKTFQAARPEDQVTLQTALARIERLADTAKGEAASYCYCTLGALNASMQDHAALEKYARKTLALDPKSQVGIEQLQQSLLAQGRHADLLKTAQAFVDQVPTARNCYLLAKALVLNQRYDLAEQACALGLKVKSKRLDADKPKLEPDDADVHCLLGLTALLMRHSDDAATLKVVRLNLDDARRLCRPESGDDLLVDCDYLAAIHQALIGEPGIALVRLQHLQREHPESHRYEKAIQAFRR